MRASVPLVGPAPRPPGTGAAARGGALAEIERAIERLGEASQKQRRAVRVAREVIVVRHVQVREQPMDVQTRLLTAGGLAENAKHGNLRPGFHRMRG